MDTLKSYHSFENAEIIIDANALEYSLNLRELWSYRELLFFFVWRSIKIRYKQTIIGIAWAVLQPFTTMVIFSIFFGQVAKIPSNGIPYPIFSATGLVPWTFFSGSLVSIASSITSNSNMLKKIYFPRIILPIAEMGTDFVDFLVAFVVLVAMIIAYLLFGVSNAETPIRLGFNIIFIPFFILLAGISALGFGLWLAALNVQFRDVKYSTGFLVRIWMFVTPIIYPANLVSPKWQLLYFLNPMVAVTEGFRWALLGIGDPPAMNILFSTFISLIILMSGIWFFSRMEKSFADVV